MGTEMNLAEPWRLDHKPVMKKNGFRCGNCNKPFKAELPYECTIDIWGKAIKKLRCPFCNSKKLYMGENRTLAEDRAMRKGATFGERVSDWKENGEHGMSSEAMMAHFMGEMKDDYPVPRDMSDLRRCIIMLDRFPEWKDRGQTMEIFKEWKSLTASWDQIVIEFNETADCTSPTARKIFGQDAD